MSDGVGWTVSILILVAVLLAVIGLAWHLARAAFAVATVIGGGLAIFGISTGDGTLTGVGAGLAVVCYVIWYVLSPEHWKSRQ